MKHLMVVFILGIGLAGSLSAQTDGVINDLQLGLEAGNARTVAAYFHNKVSLGIQDEQGTFDPSEAEQKLREFFLDHPPEAFNTLHQGASKENAQYVIGKLITEKQTFRTYLLLSRSKGKGQAQIQELRFE